MNPKVLVLTGLSGAGKTTLAIRLEEEGAQKAVRMDRLMLRCCENEGFDGIGPYLIHYGVTKGAERLREPLFDLITKMSVRSDLVLDALYDYKLLELMRGTFGRSNVPIIRLEANIFDRQMRLIRRGHPRAMLWDIPPIFRLGLLKIMAEADLTISGISPDETFSRCKTFLSAVRN